MPQDIEFAYQLYYNYQHYIEHSLTRRRFKHSDIVPLIKHLKEHHNLTIKEAGRSLHGRSINLIKFGEGNIKIFLWSQMHGDESTATMAIFDILNFLTRNDHFNEFRRELFSNASVYFMPMVNPDGAEIFQRRNGYEIDINRDASALITPEGQILKSTFDEIKADFGFNLHDQRINYSAGHSFKPATLSFLAPSEDYEYTLSAVRSNAVKLITHLYTILSSFIPGHIGKYPAEFEPRAFGDNFQKLGTSTILIESGGWANDIEKQFVRKMNFLALITGFKSIIEHSYKLQSLETYDEIPFNESDLMYLILRNLIYKKDGTECKIDIGINRTEVNLNGARNFYFKSAIEDIGDLSIYFGYEDYNLEGMELTVGKTFPEMFNTVSEIEKLNFVKLYDEGYTNVILNSNHLKDEFSRYPVNIITNANTPPAPEIKIGEIPNFLIKKNGKVRYSVVNGFIIDINNLSWENKNGLIIS
ncbi:MAG: M14 family zinc carboxypeptidase [Ignavibacteriaceae bacterium]